MIQTATAGYSVFVWSLPGRQRVELRASVSTLSASQLELVKEYLEVALRAEQAEAERAKAKETKP
jgi:hypothetical protein